jgi:GTPase SAR1 family protein
VVQVLFGVQMRVAIIGWPGSGKTTLATEMGGGKSTDDALHLGWSEASEAVSYWLDEPGPWIVEGVALPRALRKWKQRNPGQPPPVDKVIYLSKSFKNLQPGAVSMGKGMDSVVAEIWDWLGSTQTEIR